MRIYTADDEFIALETLRRSISRVSPQAELRCFEDGDDLLKAVEEAVPDVVFLDIHMAGMDGLELARRLKAILPKVNLIFVTGYEQYAVEAFGLLASGYVLKPIHDEEIRFLLENLRNPVSSQKAVFFAQCFGNFTFFVNGEPVSFSRSKGKELLAYLIDRRGAVVSRRELAAVLFENEPYSRNIQKNLSSIVQHLETDLLRIGAENIFLRGNDGYSVDTKRILCDLYESLNGNPQYVYTGEYAESLESKVICKILLYVFFYTCYFIFTRYISDELNVSGRLYDLLYYLFAAAVLTQSVLIAEGRNVDYTAAYPYGIGRLYWMGFAYPAVITSVVSILLFHDRTKDRAQKVTLLLYMYLPAVGVILMVVFSGNLLFRMCSLTFVMLVYLVIYIDSAQKIARRETELEESRIALMVSQIRPHFIYNTLNSIAGLCELDPMKAKDLSLKFSDYLRSNIQALESRAPIPFPEEFAHIRNYLEIEQQRFLKLHVEYNIETQSFYVPVLSIQPLVENAVKHGISVKRGGGTVRICTQETGNGYRIIISDDGVGFDTEKPITSSHFGIANARARIEDSGGRLKIKSVEGAGTTVTIFLPKEKKETR